LSIHNLNIADVGRQPQLLPVFRRRHDFMKGRIQRRLRQRQRSQLPAHGLKLDISVLVPQVPVKFERQILAVKVEPLSERNPRL
jgi:hypothetical protein